MIHTNTYQDVIVEHNDTTLTSTIFSFDSKLLFTLPGYKVLGWYQHDDLFFKDVTRVTRYPADSYCNEKHYNLYHRHKGMLLTTDMHWINDDITWERVVQACDANKKFGMLDLEGNVALPFLYDNVHTYERYSWPQSHQLFYIGTTEYIVLPDGEVFPSEGAVEAEIHVEYYLHHYEDKRFEYYEVVVLEQNIDKKWQWSAFQFFENIIIYEYRTGFIHTTKPEIDIEYGIEYKDSDKWQLWQFPTVPDDITVKLSFGASFPLA